MLFHISEHCYVIVNSVIISYIHSCTTWAIGINGKQHNMSMSRTFTHAVKYLSAVAPSERWAPRFSYFQQPLILPAPAPCTKKIQSQSIFSIMYYVKTIHKHKLFASLEKQCEKSISNRTNFTCLLQEMIFYWRRRKSSPLSRDNFWLIPYQFLFLIFNIFWYLCKHPFTPWIICITCNSLASPVFLESSSSRFSILPSVALILPFMDSMDFDFPSWEPQKHAMSINTPSIVLIIF